MQTIFLTGNLAADCEIVKGRDDAEFIKFIVASNDPKAEKDEKPTYFSCRMKKTGVADILKKGRFVTVLGNLKVSTNIKDDKTYVNLDVWANAVELPPLAKEGN